MIIFFEIDWLELCHFLPQWLVKNKNELTYQGATFLSRDGRMPTYLVSQAINRMFGYVLGKMNPRSPGH